jgi:predicted 3-demethylubiquinone-9 3-methyltransferase (glyoxalase superfamily)
VSWQIVPKVLYELIGDPDREKSQRMAAMLKMKKIEIAELERAAAAA